MYRQLFLSLAGLSLMLTGCQKVSMGAKSNPPPAPSYSPVPSTQTYRPPVQVYPPPVTPPPPMPLPPPPMPPPPRPIYNPPPTPPSNPPSNPPVTPNPPPPLPIYNPPATPPPPPPPTANPPQQTQVPPNVQGPNPITWTTVNRPAPAANPVPMPPSRANPPPAPVPMPIDNPVRKVPVHHIHKVKPIGHVVHKTKCKCRPAVHEVEFPTREILHCRWEPTGTLMSYLEYDPVNHIVRLNPEVKFRHEVDLRGIHVVTGLPPYYGKGLSLVTSSGVPVAHIRYTDNGTIWYERGTAYPFESYWGNLPGGPQAEAYRGVCWTYSLQPTPPPEP